LLRRLSTFQHHHDVLNLSLRESFEKTNALNRYSFGKVLAAAKDLLSPPFAILWVLPFLTLSTYDVEERSTAYLLCHQFSAECIYC